MSEDIERQAFEQIEARLKALSPDEITAATTTSLAIAGRRAVQAGTWIATERFNERPVRDLYQELPEQQFDQHHVDAIVTLGHAARHIDRRRRDARVLNSSQRRLPEPVADSARDIRARMLKLLDYNLGHVDEVAPILTDIRADISYDTLDADLSRLADLYNTHHDLVSRDPVNYRETDVANARRLSAEIAAIIDDKERADGVARWDAARDRVWTLLSASYEQVRRGANFIFHGHDDILNNKFPALNRRTRPTPTPEPISDPQEPVDDEA